MKKPSLKQRTALRVLRSGFRSGSAVLPSFTAERAVRYFITPERLPRPGWENEILESAKCWKLKNGLAAYTWGSGPKVLLIHGWDGRGTQMGRIAASIAAAGFEATAIDLPAHGESPGDFTHVVEAKNFILSTGEELGSVRAVIAHSFGACATIYALHEGLRAERMIDLAGANRFTGIFDRYLDFIHVRGKAREIFRQKLENLVGLDADENFAAVWASHLSQPALIIHDRDDQDAPFADGEEIHAAWKGSRLFSTKGLGHRRILKSREVLEQILNFIAN
ncbi:MAG: alpha/beta hydrolase [Cryobacterium sp.]|nr:alpha/beta hydrolase [Oligoflexia bacterium]